MSRGILYTIWGKHDRKLLRKSIRSAKQFGYQFMVRDVSNEQGEGFQKRHTWTDLPFDTTLLLDMDTQIKGNIDYGFEMAERFGVACCMAPAAQAYHMDGNAIKRLHHRDMPQYNCGVIFIHNRMQPYLKELADLLLTYPQSGHNDQPYFSYIFSQIPPFILPKNYNYRAKSSYEGTLFGDLKIRHAR